MKKPFDLPANIDRRVHLDDALNWYASTLNHLQERFSEDDFQMIQQQVIAVALREINKPSESANGPTDDEDAQFLEELSVHFYSMFTSAKDFLGNLLPKHKEIVDDVFSNSIILIEANFFLWPSKGTAKHTYSSKLHFFILPAVVANSNSIEILHEYVHAIVAELLCRTDKLPSAKTYEISLYRYFQEVFTMLFEESLIEGALIDNYPELVDYLLEIRRMRDDADSLALRQATFQEYSVSPSEESLRSYHDLVGSEDYLLALEFARKILAAGYRFSDLELICSRLIYGLKSQLGEGALEKMPKIPFDPTPDSQYMKLVRVMYHSLGVPF